MNLMTSNVLNGLIGAATKVELAKVPMAFYSREASKPEPNEELLAHARELAGDEMSAAMENNEKAAHGLEEAQLKAKEQMKAENDESIKHPKAEKTDQKTLAPTSADSVEISETGKVAASQEKAKPKLEGTPVAPESTAVPTNPQTYSAARELVTMEAAIPLKFSATA